MLRTMAMAALFLVGFLTLEAAASEAVSFKAPPLQGTPNPARTVFVAAVAADDGIGDTRRHGFSTPTFSVPGFSAPRSANPSFSVPRFSSPGFSSPTFQRPGFSPSTFSSPTFSSPTFSRPTF